MHFKLLLIALVFGIVSCNSGKTSVNDGTSNSEQTEQPKAVLSGILLHKPWTKSTQSYCAQGSDYYVLKIGEVESVLQFIDPPADSWLNKQVTVIGVWKTRTIKADPMSQHPVGEDNGDFECEIFLVTKSELGQ